MVGHVIGFGAAGLTAFLFVVGCGDDSSAIDSGAGATGTTDAGETLDAAPTADAGADAMEDAGGTEDSGPPDAGPPPVCSDACGGDPTGTWRGVDTCYHENAFLSSCPTGEVLDERHEVTHSMQFAADGTWSWTLDASQQFVDYVMPAECISRRITECNEIGMGGISTGVTSCTGNVRVACTCSFMTIPLTMPITFTGTWAMVGDQVRVTTGADSRLLDICQHDDLLYLQFANPAAGSSTTQYMMQRGL